MSQKLKITKKREERIGELIKYMKATKITRYFEMDEKFQFVARRVAFDIAAISGEKSIKEIILSTNWKVSKSIVLGWGKRSEQTFLLKVTQTQEMDEEDIKKCIEEIVTEDNFNRVSGMSYRMLHTLPEPYDKFGKEQVKFTIGKANKPKDRKEQILTHLAEICISLAYCNIGMTQREKICENIQYQIKTFVGTGDLKQNKPDKLKPGSPRPKPMIFLSDDRETLVWKFSKFCPSCHERDDMCYCKEVEWGTVDKSDTISEICYGCYKERVKRAWTGEFDEQFKKEKCIQELNYALESFVDGITPYASGDESKSKIEGKIKEFRKEFGSYFEITHRVEEHRGEIENEFTVKIKKINSKKFEEIWENIQGSHDGDYDMPEGACNCATW